MFQHDPQEDDPILGPIIARVRREFDEKWRKHPSYTFMGSGALFQEEMKRALLERHGIDWKTSREMNPGVLFD